MCKFGSAAAPSAIFSHTRDGTGIQIGVIRPPQRRKSPRWQSYLSLSPSKVGADYGNDWDRRQSIAMLSVYCCKGQGCTKGPGGSSSSSTSWANNCHCWFPAMTKGRVSVTSVSQKIIAESSRWGRGASASFPEGLVRREQGQGREESMDVLGAVL